ncbi:MAG: hypothetical protein SPF21_02610 [Candidatus Methanomethylophilaceae archaeon]|nr:hypothetical protein [Candidatus Methanomethylophilaceae archaeon]
MATITMTNQQEPQGTPNSLAEIKKYLTDITDQIAQSDALTNYMTPNPVLVRAATSAGKFLVPTIETSGLGNYDRGKGTTRGAVKTSFEEYSCRYDRARSFVLDSVDIMQEDGLVQMAGVLAEFTRSEVVPEVDATRIATCASTAITATQTVSKAPAKASFLSDITTGMNAVRSSMRLRGTEGMKIHVNDKYIDVLEQSSEYSRSKSITEGLRRLDTGVDVINQAEVIYTPDEYMRTAFDYESAITTNADTVPDGGFKPSSGALEVAALIVAPNVANGLVASDATQMFGPGQVPGVFGSQLDYRIFHDCFILKNKRKGVYAITVPGSP